LRSACSCACSCCPTAARSTWIRTHSGDAPLFAMASRTPMPAIIFRWRINCSARLSGSPPHAWGRGGRGAQGRESRVRRWRLLRAGGPA
jgi:hypothetical protein